MADDIKKAGKQIAKEVETAVDKGISSVKTGASKTADAGANVLGKGADALNNGKKKLQKSSGNKGIKGKFENLLKKFKK